jgi:hypothetical protein
MTTAFSIPPAFLALESADRFNYWGAPFASLTQLQREARLRTHMTEVLWWSSIEWDRTSAEILAFSGDNFLRPGLFPFAGNGRGDRYCWYPSWQTCVDLPVLFVDHDEGRGQLFARDFAECLCRCFLRSFAEEDSGDSQFPPHLLWDAHFQILRPFLTSDQVDVLRNVRKDLSPAACEEADIQIAASIPDRALTAIQPPTRYDHRYLDRLTLLRLYDESLLFYRELVEVENRVEFTRKLEEVKAAKAELMPENRV